MTSQIELGLLVAKAVKSYGNLKALNSVDLEVQKGEFFTLLGPSGCGKTTLLRVIAGLELPDSGHVFLGGHDITQFPAAKRQVNTVFQSYALFPHLDIFENVAFGLKARNFEAGLIKNKVGTTLEMLDLNGLEKRFPHQLSGGQKQRVALARALVNEPQILLLDEPMSALDAHLRSRVQEDLRRLQRQLDTTFILVTHDQDEAMMISDRLAVMSKGQVIQTGTPREVYSKPKTQFVAEFLGAANILDAERHDNGLVTTALGSKRFSLRLNQAPPWDKGRVAIRPEHIRMADPACSLDTNWVDAKVLETIYRGQSQDLLLDPGPVRVRTTTKNHVSPGDEVILFFPPDDLVALDNLSN
ncbi:MAG: ABC transporter ATP-binding protein [Deltaproteobacteria bacterium]|nr:ABC transporter ATP-binding protein [Deltaproteobacteria bacterium]